MLTFGDLPLELRSIILKVWFDDLHSRYRKSTASYWDNVSYDRIGTTIKPHQDAAVLELKNLVRAFPSGSSSSLELRRLIEQPLATMREALYQDIGGRVMDRKLTGAVAEKQRVIYLREWTFFGVLETLMNIEA